MTKMTSFVCLFLIFFVGFYEVFALFTFGEKGTISHWFGMTGKKVPLAVLSAVALFSHLLTYYLVKK